MSENKNRPGEGMRGPGPGRGVGPVVKAKDFKGTVRKLLRYMKPFIVALIFVVLLSGASTLFTIVGPSILSQVTNEVQRGAQAMLDGTGAINFETIASTLTLLLAFYVASAAFGLIQGWILASLSAKISYKFRTEIMSKINRLPVAFFNNTTHGEVLSRITNDVDTLSNGLNQSVTQIITSVCSVIGILIMMLTISWQMTLLTLATVPINLILISIVVKISQKHFKHQQKYLGQVNSQVEEMYGGLTIVKAFNQEHQAITAFDDKNNKLKTAAFKAEFISGLMHPIMVFVGNLGYVMICVVGAAMTASGTLTLGGIQAFLQYSRSFNQPFSQLAQISNQMQMTVAAAERVFELLESPEEVQSEGTLSTENAHIKGDVRFENVRFGYGDGPDIIKDFSADIKAGQKVAIVGPTGAGKTTVVKLLMRFYDLRGGAIYIDGHNSTDFGRRDLRTEFAMVLQDTWLYNSTIMENIRYGRKDATDEEVIAAARSAQVDYFVRTLPDGYNMMINEEADNISQGQKQLLTIARAILADCRVLILDEATSSVDTRTEVLIQKAMDNLMKGRTSFIIAHRLSTIKNADLILCMKDGDIVEQGTHSELMAQNGFYAELYNSQFEKVS